MEMVGNLLRCDPPWTQPMDTLVPTVIIMRGWPGSGKSVLARALQFYLIERYSLWPLSAVVVSADTYHISPFTGKYKWLPENVATAHAVCRREFAFAVARRKTVIIVDNTNIKKKDYAYYVETATGHGYEVRQAIPNTPWMHSPEECFRRNVHNVPLDTIKRMQESFEKDDELEHVVYRQELQSHIERATRF